MTAPEEPFDRWADQLDPERLVDPERPDPLLAPGERARLDVVAAVLRDPTTWDEPPAGLRDSLLAAARTQAHPDDELGRRRHARDSRRRSTRWWVAAGGVAAAAALAAVLVAWPRPHPATLAMAGTALAPKASAVAELDPRPAGLAIHLQITGLPPAPDGRFYAAWLRGPRGTVPVGTFHWHAKTNPVDLWSGVLTTGYPELFVTLQREGDPPDPSADVVLVGHVAG